MAVYKENIVDIDLAKGSLHRSFLTHTIGSGDVEADHFGVRVFRDGEPVDLTDVSVQGIFNPPQGSPIALTSGNVISGNVAAVVLKQACYNYNGQFCLSIKLVGGGVTGTMRIVDGVVDNTHSTGTVAPTEEVPTYQEVIAQYDAMVAATAAANGAIAKPYAQLTFPVKKGEYTIVDGALKRALVDIATSETYTAAHWTDAKLGPDLSQLKSAIASTESLIESAFAIEKIDKNSTGVLNGYISYNGTSATVVTQSANYKTIYQKALNGANVLILTGSNTASSIYGKPALVFYDSSKVMLNSGLVEWSASTVFDFTYVEVPEGAAYFSFDGRITNDLAFSASMYYRYKDKIDDLYGKVAECAKKYLTVSQMIADTSLKSGMVAITCGYAWANDGGDALYRISSTASGVYETLSNGLYAIANIDESSILNWTGNTVESKLQDFLNRGGRRVDPSSTSNYMVYPNKLDLKGRRIEITQRFTKSDYSYLTYTTIANAIFFIPDSVGGWLDIYSNGHRCPIFENCIFAGGGSVGYDYLCGFTAIGCTFINNTSIIRDGTYSQSIDLVGCHVGLKNNYLIDVDMLIDARFVDCGFEAYNKGIIKTSDGTVLDGTYRASLASCSFIGCIIEGLTDTVILSCGARDVQFVNTYIEKVPYLLVDTVMVVDGEIKVNEFKVSVRGCHINNRQIENQYLMTTECTSPTLLASDNFYLANSGQYMVNCDNRMLGITDHNLIGGDQIYGYQLSNGVSEAAIAGGKFTAKGNSFSFRAMRDIPSNPQAFLVLVEKSIITVETKYVYQEVYLLTLEHRSDAEHANDYTVISTPLVQSEHMTADDRITWTVSATAYTSGVTISGTSTNVVRIAVTNLGSVFSAFANPRLSGVTT